MWSAGGASSCAPSSARSSPRPNSPPSTPRSRRPSIAGCPPLGRSYWRARPPNSAAPTRGGSGACAWRRRGWWRRSLTSASWRSSSPSRCSRCCCPARPTMRWRLPSRSPRRRAPCCSRWRPGPWGGSSRACGRCCMTGASASASRIWWMGCSRRGGGGLWATRRSCRRWMWCQTRKRSCTGRAWGGNPRPWTPT
ncbi:hypothetical protein BU14_0071s0042 [Porphyra umbilicalis]|uniref:Uncharacterized protein n=1 Tax=Porphyra umbilicalis TaxID=2786 RepID=A0A1X6PG70_PORUM|nr:hypothetical protein BU14_0071s0042 [Porphyra umbilicalis]|eukprot:OSX79788.1 hypothetical protein BU14_0071s0042 [Porphyra umbilicalis]